LGAALESDDGTLGTRALDGSGGKADGTATALLALSWTLTGLDDGFEGTEIFNPAVPRFSAALLPG
jgi:hypothetical protein